MMSPHGIRTKCAPESENAKILQTDLSPREIGKKVMQIKLIQSKYAMASKSILHGHGEFSKSTLIQSAGHCDSEIPSGKKSHLFNFYTKEKMNLEIVLQLSALLFVVAAGPLVILLISSRDGNL